MPEPEPELEPEPEAPRFACVGCGVSNPVGAETCSGCGHRFAGPAGESPPMRFPTPRVAPAVPRASSDAASWVGSILILIVILGIGAGVSINYGSYGIIVLLIAVAPALIRASLLTVQRSRQGKPIGIDGWLGLFSVTLGASFLVILASAIAFVGTCVPVGLVTMQGEFANGYFPWVAGGLAALVVGAGVTRWLIRTRWMGHLSQEGEVRR